MVSIIGVWGLLACVLSIQRGPLSQYILFLRKSQTIFVSKTKHTQSFTYKIFQGGRSITVHVDQEAGQVNIIGASLSEPHTSGIALH